MLKDRLVEARKHRRQTQKDLADLSGLAQSQVSIYERGKENRTPKPDTLQKIANALDLVLMYYADQAYFYDPHLDESIMSEDDIAEREIFNQLQEHGAKEDAEIKAFDTPEDFEKEWIRSGGAPHDSRAGNIARIEFNEKKLNDKGIQKLANYSDDLVSSGNYDI